MDRYLVIGRLRSCLGNWMKYKIVKDFIEQQKIIIKNATDMSSLCRVDVNHRLFKIIYLEPQSVVELVYDIQQEISEVKISELK